MVALLPASHLCVQMHPASCTKYSAACFVQSAGLGMLGCIIRLTCLLLHPPAQLLQDGKRISVAAKLVGSAENDASCFERVHNEVSWLAGWQLHPH